MVAPDEVIRLVLQSEEAEAHQRRLGEREPLLHVPAQVVHQALLLLLPRNLAPVLVREGDLHPAVNDLERLVQPFPEEGGAQQRVPVHRQQPGSPERRDVEPAVELTAQLLEVDARTRGRQGME